MIRAKSLVLAIATSILVVACGPENEKITCDLSSTSSQSPQSQSLTISMYVDGTPSMGGYVNPQNTKTRYAETIDLLDQILFAGGTVAPRTKSQLEYYRLGETTTKTDRDGYLKARNSKFYDGTDPKFPLLKVSKIETAITPALDGKLTVIVTDLYQDGEDVTKLNKKIRDNYFKGNQLGYAVGILGIRSEFNGDVFLEDGSNRSFKYNTNDARGNKIKGQEFRPFYVIFLGHSSDIAHYFQNLSESKKLPEDSQLAIFSPNNLVNGLSYLQGSPKLPEGFQSTPQELGNANVILARDDKSQLLELENNINKPLNINYTVPFKNINNTLLIETNSLQTETKVESFDSIEKKFKEPPNNSSLLKALELSKWQIDNNKNLNFVTTIKPSDFPETGIYKFTVDVLAKGVQEQKWWSEWTANNNTNNDWRTYNLQPFLQGLKSSTDDILKTNKVVVGRFCYGIQKN